MDNAHMVLTPKPTYFILRWHKRGCGVDYVWLRNARRAMICFILWKVMDHYWYIDLPHFEMASALDMVWSRSKSCNLTLSIVSTMWTAVFSSNVMYWCISLSVFFRALFAYEGVTNNLKLTDSGGETANHSSSVFSFFLSLGFFFFLV